MKFCKRLFTLIFALFLSASLTSCKTTKEDDTIPPNPTAVNKRGKVETKGFLATTDLALRSWLKKRFSINYVEMTPQQAFGNPPLNGIAFQTSNLPTDAPPLSLQSPGLSRRELLKKIANFWKLEIAIVTDSEGSPISITVTGKSQSE